MNGHNPTGASASSISLLGLAWSVFWRHKFKIVLVPTAFLLLAVAVIVTSQRTYFSQARIFLSVGRESIGLDPAATTGQTMSIQQVGRDSEIRSAIELMSGRGVIGNVVDDLGPQYVLDGGPAGEAVEKEPGLLSRIKDNTVGRAIGMLKGLDPVSDRELAVITLERGLSIDSERGTAIIRVGYEADTPIGAQAIVNKVVEAYRQEHLRIHRNSESQDFFEEQRDRFRSELATAQEDLRKAKNRIGIASIDERRTALESQIQAIDLDAYTTQQGLSTARARVADLREQLQETPERLLATKTTVPNEGADTLRDRLYTLQLREMDLKARYQDSHPLVTTASAQVAEAKRVVDAQQANREQVTDDVNPIHRQLSLELRQIQNEVAGLSARATKLDEQRRLVLLDMEDLNKHEVELRDLERLVGIAESKRMRYEEDYEQARIDRALENKSISSIRIAQQATLNEKPVSPSKPLLLVGAMLLAIGLTASWVVINEQAGFAVLVARPQTAPAPEPAVVASANGATPANGAVSNGVGVETVTAELARSLH